MQRVLFVVAVAGLAVIAGADAVRQPQQLRLEPDQPHRAALRPGHRDADQERLRRRERPASAESGKFIVWPLLPLLGAVQSVGIGGEVKKVRRSQLFGMLGAVVATGVVIALFAVLSNKAFGYNFQGAIAYNSLTGVTGGIDRHRAVVRGAGRHPRATTCSCR